MILKSFFMQIFLPINLFLYTSTSVIYAKKYQTLFSFYTHFEEFKSSHVLMNLIIAINVPTFLNKIFVQTHFQMQSCVVSLEMKTKLNKRHNRWNKNTCFIVLLPASFISSLQCNTPWKIYCPQKKVSNVVLQIILRHTTLITTACMFVRECVSVFKYFCDYKGSKVT